MFSRLQFYAAVLVAAAARLAREWVDLRASMAIRTAVAPETIQERLDVCAACPIYFRPLATCGSPLRRIWYRVRLFLGFSVHSPGYTFYGCDCHMPTKARVQSNCWAYDRRMIYGWQTELNSFPPDASA